MAVSRVLTAVQNETVDQLVWRANGGGPAAVQAVLNANPGLAGHGPFLPEGTAVVLPATATQTAEPVALVQLWD